MLFSATMPPRIEDIAKRHLNNAVRVRVARVQPTEGEASKINQRAYLVRRENKLAALGRVLDVERPSAAIVFCRTRTEADELTEMLTQRDFRPKALHGGLSQEQRDRVMKQFRAGSADLLIATDIAARGLDISHLSHVINFDVPQQPEAYVHRIGRVGRAGRDGIAITLVSPHEQSALRIIERTLKQPIVYAPIPSVKDLRAARLERTKQRLREQLANIEATGDLRAIVDELENEFTAKDIALMAAKLLTEPSRGQDDTEIPQVFQGGAARRDDRAPRNQAARPDDRRRMGTVAPRSGMTRVFFGIGRDANVTPRDLVGAITNEAGIPGRDLGAIDVGDRFALVEVPSEVAEYVVEAMQGARIKGRKVNVRPDRPPLGGYGG